MRLKVYQAPSVSDAMARVRAELGPEALILSTRRVAGGIELTAALEQADAAPDDLPDERHTLPLAAAPDGLAFHGVPLSMAARLAGPDLAAALRATLRFGMLPIARDGPPLMLAGMPGAGKTLSVARLATRLVMAGIPPLVISADGRRAGAAEELAAYTRLLGAGLIVASTPSTLARALRQRQPGSPVLIDTPGANPFDDADLGAVRALAEAAGAILVLVMPGGLDCAEAEDQALAFAPLGTRHLLATRLDLVRRLGSLLAAAARADLIFTEAGVGAGATDGLAPLTAEFLAERLSMPRGEAAAAPRSAAGQPPRPPGGAPPPSAWTPRRLSAAEQSDTLLKSRDR